MSQNLEDLKRLYQLAKQAMQSKDFAKAIPALESILKGMPEEGALWHNLGSCYLETHNEAKAILAYEQCLTCDASNADAAFNLGVLSADPERAQHYYKQAVQLNHHAAHYNLALLCMDAQPDLAKQLLSAYLEDEQGNASAQYVLAALGGKTLDTAPSGFIADLFDQYADHFDAHLSYLNYQTPSKIADLICLQAKDQILDLGCGTGLMADALPDNSQIIGVDLSEKCLAIAKKKGRYQDLHCSEITQFLKQTAQRFDWILAADVLVYLGDCQALFAEVAKHLKPGASFIYSVEKGDVFPFQLNKSKRFSHYEKYLDEIIKGAGMYLVSRDLIVLREQGGVPVMGYLDVVKV